MSYSCDDDPSSNFYYLNKSRVFFGALDKISDKESLSEMADGYEAFKIIFTDEFTLSRV